MERQVFVSHAVDDPDWPPEVVETVASAIREAGIVVRLDLWHEREMKRGLSLSEWRSWMDDVIRSSTHILCLVSPRYLRLWERRPEDAGGFGVAFESIRLIHTLYLLKQRNEGRVFTLRPESSGYDCIPPDLMLDCTAYRWAADRAKVLSHVGDAAIPGHAPLPGALSPAGTRPPWASDNGKDTYGWWADLTVNGVTQRMRWVPPTGPEGFWMGSPQSERDAIKANDLRAWANKHEHAPSRVVVPDGFWLADTPCSQAFWRAVADIDPSYFGYVPEAPERPVENVSWDAVMEQFIARFATTPEWVTGDRLCLPTEEEWEYAARAGTRTAYWWGDTPDGDRANWGGLHSSTTTVKRYPPNPWGLYDVHGNVWEWCADMWQPHRNAPGARLEENVRVVRGGSWVPQPVHARAAYRHWAHRRLASRDLGFRFALRSPIGPKARSGGPGV